MSSAPTRVTITTDDVMLDLEAGRSVEARPADRLLELRALPRPTLGGGVFVRTLLTARALGAIRPRLARPALRKLWFTPWPHPSVLRTVADDLDGFVHWSLPMASRTLHGFAGGTGPTVVLVHGWAGRGADLRHLARDLIDRGWRVVVPDLPAHGSTDGDRTDLFELGGAFAAVLDRERPVAVIAHSLGFPTTVLALAGGAHRPDLIVALAPGRKMSHAMGTFATKVGLRPALLEELRRGIEADYGRDIWDVLDVDRTLPDLTIDGIVIHDVDDEEVTLADGRAIVDRWPGSRLVETQGLGHRRIVRDPSVRALVVDAIDRISADR